MSSWNVMAHGDARAEGSEGETGEWSGWPVLFTLPQNMVYPALLPLMRTPRLPVVDWTDTPADLNGFVRFAERRNLVSARVPSHFKRSLPVTSYSWVASIFCVVASQFHTDLVYANDRDSTMNILFLWLLFSGLLDVPVVLGPGIESSFPYRS